MYRKNTLTSKWWVNGCKLNIDKKCKLTGNNMKQCKHADFYEMQWTGYEIMDIVIKMSHLLEIILSIEKASKFLQWLNSWRIAQFTQNVNSKTLRCFFFPMKCTKHKYTPTGLSSNPTGFTLGLLGTDLLYQIQCGLRKNLTKARWPSWQ